MDSLLPTNEKPPNRFTIAVGALVRAARRDIGLTQGELARLASVHRNTISNVEAGKVELSVSTLVMLSQVLGRPLSYFIPLDKLGTYAEEAQPVETVLAVDEEPESTDLAVTETGFELVMPDVSDYDSWKAANALKLAQVLAWIQTYNQVDREPTDDELADVREALLEAHVGRQEFTVKEIAEEWIRKNSE